MTRVALPPRLPLILAAASFGFSIVQLDVTIVNVALDAIGREFGAPTASLQWVVDAYTLLLAALLLSAGALGDRFGPRRAFLAGLVLFAVSSAACGLARDALQLVLARAIQGAAAALLVPPSLALITHAAAGDDRARAWAVGWWTAAGGVSIAAGPVIGGLLIGALGWRWVFLVNLPLCLLGAALTLAFVPEVPPREKRPLDLPGQVLGFVALACLVGAVIEGGHRGWDDALVLAALVAGLATAAAFLAVEMRSAHPAVPLEVFRSRMVWSTVVIGVGVNFTYYGVIFVLGLFLQRSAGYSVLQAGLAFLPLTATFIVSNLLSGRVAQRFGSARTMAGGVLVAAVGYALTSRLTAHSPFWSMIPGFLLIPAGMGMAVPAMTSALLASVDRHLSGTASGVLNACRQAAGAAGVAVMGTLAAGGPDRIAAGLRISGLVAAAVLLGAAWVAWRSDRRRDPSVGQPTATE
ncbi:MFS transporter [Caulobacter sp. BE254]|uniref:MFS transporter n=1 Tax=Caulobacter sp. BE254 TaxID=2817720 RepID=UPI00285A26B2|nr:MFS transporter [Caulobacter sp. BE254]MDR7116413.1 DHA2 family methylenomycin A resistance protein-like MFS transporter [Caulobacter sp. BE254]